MNAKQRLIVHYFLRSMQVRMQFDKVVEINPVWAKIYDTSELKEIVKRLYLNAIPEDVKLDEMSNLQLLDLIGDDYHILCQFIEELENELSATLKPTPKSVGKTLSQLGLETHYLGNKPIEDWDNYDHGNYKNLIQKAGVSLPIYGIFPNAMEMKDKYITPVMGKYHLTERQAKSAVSLLVSTEQYTEGEFQILPV
jgi:hypothetical protein